MSHERGLNPFAKSIDLCQPAQSAQADMGRNFSVSFIFQHVNLFLWGLTPYQEFFSYLKATVYKSMFPGLFLTCT